MKQDKARLKWFLDFLYIDTDSLSRVEFFKLLVDLGSILYDPFLTQVGSGEFPFADSLGMRREIKEYRERLKQVLDAIMGKGPMPIELALSEKHPMEGLGELLTMFKDSRGTVRGSLAMTQKILRVKDRAFLVPARKKDLLLIKFMATLSSFSLDNIKKCKREGCGRYFLEATKRRKRYCSDKCAWVVNSRERRKAGTKKTKRRGGIKK